MPQLIFALSRTVIEMQECAFAERIQPLPNNRAWHDHRTTVEEQHRGCVEPCAEPDGRTRMQDIKNMPVTSLR